MSHTIVGYARCSTDRQDLTAQRAHLFELGVAEGRIYLDRGLTGANRERPGLDQAMAAVRDGDTLVVPKLDRLARSVPDARDIEDTLLARGSGFHSVARSTTRPTLWARCSSTSWPRLPSSKSTFFGCALARAWPSRANGKLRGKQPKLCTKHQAELRRMHATGALHRRPQ